MQWWFVYNFVHVSEFKEAGLDLGKPVLSHCNSDLFKRLYVDYFARVSEFKEAGLDLEKPVVTHCNSGMSSCSLALAAYMCGAKDVVVYHVSLSSLTH